MFFRPIFGSLKSEEVIKHGKEWMENKNEKERAGKRSEKSYVPEVLDVIQIWQKKRLPEKGEPVLGNTVQRVLVIHSVHHTDDVTPGQLNNIAGHQSHNGNWSGLKGRNNKLLLSMAPRPTVPPC
jgi:hypothetical protein